MSEKITNEQYTKAMYIIRLYLKQLDKPIELECLEHILLDMQHEICRQKLKIIEYERIKQECEKEQTRLKEMRS